MTDKQFTAMEHDEYHAPAEYDILMKDKRLTKAQRNMLKASKKDEKKHLKRIKQIRKALKNKK
jgi:hypothetical protein